MVGCMSCNRNSQWNINSTVGWNSVNPEDFVVLILKQRGAQTNDHLGNEVKQLDSILSSELAHRKLGESVEVEDGQNTELQYVVSNDFKPALEVIMETVKNFGIQVVIVKRKYRRDGSWNDEIL